MSFEFELDEKDRARSELIGTLGSELQSLFAKRKKEEGLTQQQLADDLDVGKSRVNRCLTGYANLTYGTTADLNRALRGKILIKIVPEEEASRWAIHYSGPAQTTSGNNAVSGEPQKATVSTQKAASGTWR